MKSRGYLAFIVLGWLCIAVMMLGFSTDTGAAAPLTCEDLVGLTYRVFIPTQKFVCFEFIAGDMVIETHETAGSFSVMYFIKGERLGSCDILTQIPFPPGSLEARVRAEKFIGIGLTGVRPTISFLVVGRRVPTGACQPGDSTGQSDE
jgi:hypothetical protein